MDTPETPPPEPQAAGKFQAFWLKWRLFIAGFLGWFLFELLFWSLLYGLSRRERQGNMEEILIINCVPVLLTLGVMIFYALNKQTRMVSLGILAAIAVNIVFSQLILGTIEGAICFTPFFLDLPMY